MFLRKRTKLKVIRCCKGVVSLFLCILLTPFLTIASALIEFSRYQGTVEVLQEVMDLSALSTLAEFDDYLAKRFGLFAVSQSKDINDTYSSNFKSNVSLLGKGVTVNSANANGQLPLVDTGSDPNFDVLKAQLTDFSESTVLTEFFLNDVGIEDLLSTLFKSQTQLKNMADTAETVSKLVGAVDDLVDAVIDAYKALEKANLAIQKAKDSAAEFTDAYKEFYKKLKDDSFVMPVSANDDDSAEETEEYKEGLEPIVTDHLSDLKELYTKADSFATNISSAKTALSNIANDSGTGKLQKLAKSAIDFVKEVEKATQDDDKDKDKDKNKDNGISAIASAKTVSTEMMKKIGDLLVDGIKKGLNKYLDTGLTGDVLSGVTNFLNDYIANGVAVFDRALEKIENEWGVDRSKKNNLNNFYKVELSNEAVTELKKIMKHYDDEDLDMGISGLSFSLTGLYDELKSTEDSIKDFVLDSVTDTAANALEELINTIKGLFELSVFYNPNLDSFISESAIAVTETDNPYIRFLKAINAFLNAADDFVSGLAELNFKKVIKAVLEFAKGVIEISTASFLIVKNLIDNISELTTLILTGDFKGLYQRFLLSTYMAHDLPNRTSAGKFDIKIDENWKSSTTVKLTGSALTGFSYSSLKTPALEDKDFIFRDGNVWSAEENGPLSKNLMFNSLFYFINALKNGGSDTMFKGAELEYIAAGTQSEIVNQIVAFMQLYVLRLLLDVIPIVTNQQVQQMAEAANIASWAVLLLVILIEPFVDSVLLVNGEDVELIKTQIYLTPEGIPSLVTDIVNAATDNKSIKEAVKGEMTVKEPEKTGGTGTGTDKKNDMGGKVAAAFNNKDYATHMMLILTLTVPLNDLMLRFSNIVQLEAAYYYGNPSSGESKEFDIKKAYTNVYAQTDVNFNSFIDIFRTNDSSSPVKGVFSEAIGY